MTHFSRPYPDKLKPIHSAFLPAGQLPEAGYARPTMVAPPASCIAETPAVPTIRILRLPEVLERVGLCRASIYQRMPQGTFPKSIPLGPRTIGWLESEIECWLKERLQARYQPKL